MNRMSLLIPKLVYHMEDGLSSVSGSNQRLIPDCLDEWISDNVVEDENSIRPHWVVISGAYNEQV